MQGDQNDVYTIKKSELWKPAKEKFVGLGKWDQIWNPHDMAHKPNARNCQISFQQGEREGKGDTTPKEGGGFQPWVLTSNQLPNMHIHSPLLSMTYLGLGWTTIECWPAWVLTTVREICVCEGHACIHIHVCVDVVRGLVVTMHHPQHHHASSIV